MVLVNTMSNFAFFVLYFSLLYDMQKFVFINEPILCNAIIWLNWGKYVYILKKAFAISLCQNMY